MKGLRAHRLNGPSALNLETFDSPEPGPAQVLITVAAAGLHLADLAASAGERLPLPPTPFIPGLEVSGTVAALGEGVSGLKKGDKVAAFTDWGGLAEQVVAETQLCLKLPKGLQPDVAAALPMAYAGALLALRHKAGLNGGEMLLVLGAGGLAGLAAIAVGKMLGATVMAVAAGDARGSAAADQGADHVIDATATALTDAVEAFTGGAGSAVVFDPVGGEASDLALATCGLGARYLVAGFAGGRVGSLNARTAFARDVKILAANTPLTVAAAKPAARSALQEVLIWAASGKIAPRIGARFKLDDAKSAIDYVQNRRATGAVLVTMGE